MPAVALLACLLSGPSPSVLDVAYRFDDLNAPLYAACLNPADLKSRYGIYLEEVSARQEYDLVDGDAPVLRVRLAREESDSAVLARLLDGRSEVGLVAAEVAMRATVDGRPVRIIAPLQRRGDKLLVSRSRRLRDWPAFLAWVKQRSITVRIGFLGREPMGLFALDQAFEMEYVTRSADPTDTAAKVWFVRAENPAQLVNDLAAGRLDAAVLATPLAEAAAAPAKAAIIADVDELAPNRFEDRPGTVIASNDAAIRARGADITRFLELLAVATHYANNRTAKTASATARWVGTSPKLEASILATLGFSSMPDAAFKDGLWNWYFALRLKAALPDSLSKFMSRDEWLGVPYDSTLLVPALERAGARIIR